MSLSSPNSSPLNASIRGPDNEGGKPPHNPQKADSLRRKQKGIEKYKKEKTPRKESVFLGARGERIPPC